MKLIDANVSIAEKNEIQHTYQGYFPMFKKYYCFYFYILTQKVTLEMKLSEKIGH
jgi:hypothetical protein